MHKRKHKICYKNRFLCLLFLYFSSLTFAFADHIDFVVPKSTIAVGQVISPENLEKKKFYIKAEAASRYVLNPSQITGKVAKRVLLPGKAIALSYLGEPKVVTKGQATKLVFQSGALIITAIGVPLEDGSVGDWIRVRNTDSGRLVSGVVLKDGSVQVGVQ